MESLLSVAGEMFHRYLKENGVMMTEMKLHKLMYFVQREGFVQLGLPIFEGHFYAWKYGPVLKEIRNIYISESFDQLQNVNVLNPQNKQVVDFVYSNLCDKDPWTLSSLTHLEFSWQNARKGISVDSACDAEIKNEDIMIDAENVKKRRAFARL